jgi:hypothetical protein
VLTATLAPVVAVMPATALWTRRQVAYASPTLTNRVHTMAVMILGTKQTAAKGTDVAIDRISIRWRPCRG